jgi:hypothetical protein
MIYPLGWLHDYWQKNWKEPCYATTSGYAILLRKVLHRHLVSCLIRIRQIELPSMKLVRQ